MNFLFLGIFLGFFSEFISNLNNKYVLKNNKNLLFFARVPRGSATRAHAAPTWRIDIFIIIYIVYNGYSAFRISEGFSNLINRRVL